MGRHDPPARARSDCGVHSRRLAACSGAGCRRPRAGCYRRMGGEHMLCCVVLGMGLASLAQLCCCSALTLPPLPLPGLAAAGQQRHLLPHPVFGVHWRPSVGGRCLLLRRPGGQRGAPAPGAVHGWLRLCACCPALTAPPPTLLHAARLPCSPGGYARGSATGCLLGGFSAGAGFCGCECC